MDGECIYNFYSTWPRIIIIVTKQTKPILHFRFSFSSEKIFLLSSRWGQPVKQKNIADQIVKGLSVDCKPAFGEKKKTVVIID